MKPQCINQLSKVRSLLLRVWCNKPNQTLNRS